MIKNNPVELLMAEEIPSEVNKLVGLLANVNLSLRDIDKEMGWEDGETSSKLRKYPLLASTANEARVLALRKVGLSRLDAYIVIAESLKATKKIVKRKFIGDDGEVEYEYEDVVDHKTRLDGAQKILNIIGDDVNIVNNLTMVQSNNFASTEESEKLKKISEVLTSMNSVLGMKKVQDGEVIDVKKGEA